MNEKYLPGDWANTQHLPAFCLWVFLRQLSLSIPPSTHYRGIFSKIIVCIPDESRYQNDFTRRARFFPMSAVNDRLTELKWTMGVQISSNARNSKPSECVDRTIKLTQLLTFSPESKLLRRLVAVSLCFYFSLFFSGLFFKTQVLLPHLAATILPLQWSSSLHELRGRHLVASLVSIQMWSARISRAQEVGFTIKVILWILFPNIHWRNKVCVCVLVRLIENPSIPQTSLMTSVLPCMTQRGWFKKCFRKPVLLLLALE